MFAFPTFRTRLLTKYFSPIAFFLLLYRVQSAGCALALLGTAGIALLVLGCVLPSPRNWHPLFVVIFYVLSPLPSLIARRCTKDRGAISSAARASAYFFTAAIVISAFALPIVLASLPVPPHVRLPGTEGDGAVEVWSVF